MKSSKSKTPKREYVRPEDRQSHWDHSEGPVEKVVTTAGTSGHVYLPPTWIGRKVRVQLVD